MIQEVMLKTEELLHPTRKLVHGWCSMEKAGKLISYINQNRPDLCVEIGVFGGASLLPQALALKDNGHGKIIGIDPWANDAALEEMQHEENRRWWGSVNLEDIYQHCQHHVRALKLQDHVELIRNKAENVATSLQDGSVGMLHIDGNHSEALSYKDVTLYLPKVASGGIIFFDDIWWTDGQAEATTRRAILHLLERCTRLELVDDCMILRKN